MSDDPTPLTPPEPAPPVTADWSHLRASLPAELRDNPILNRFDDATGETPGLGGLVKSYAEVQKLVGGDKITKPGKDATVQDYATYYTKLGRPESAEKYDLEGFTPPEGVPWDVNLQAGLMQDCFDAGVPNAEMGRLLRGYANRVGGQYKEAMERMATAAAAAGEELRTEWGAAYDANEELADRAFSAMFGDDAPAIAAMQLSDGTLLGDHPGIIRGVYKLASQLSEDALIDGNAGPRGGFTPDAAKAEIAKMEGDPTTAKIMTTPGHPEHKETMARFTGLFDAAYPEGA